MNFVSDINTSLSQVLTDGTLKYVYGLGLAYAVDSLGNLQVSHTDGLGSIRALTDANGNVVQTYQTDAFGVSTQIHGTSPRPSGFTNQGATFRFPTIVRPRRIMYNRAGRRQSSLSTSYCAREVVLRPRLGSNLAEPRRQPPG